MGTQPTSRLERPSTTPRTPHLALCAPCPSPVAALNAVRRAAAVAVRDNPRFPYTARGLRPFALMRDGVSWVRDVGDYSSSVVEGVVATLTPRGEDVRVTFRTQRVELPVLQCTETNRIHRILLDGTIQYRRNCVQTGTRLVDVTPPAGLVHRDFATGIAVGHALRAYQGSSNEDVRTAPRAQSRVTLRSRPTDETVGDGHRAARGAGMQTRASGRAPR